METTMASDMRISKQSLRVLRQKFDQAGWRDAALELFGREPVLAEHVSNEFESVRQKLLTAGLPEDQVARLMPRLARLALESLLLLDRSHRQLWDSFLPSDDVATKFLVPDPLGGARRRSFATVAWDPKHVQALRPDLTEWEAKVFLEYRELEIGSAAHDAGWAVMRELLKDYRPGGGAS